MIKVNKETYPLLEKVFDIALKGSGLIGYNLLRQIENKIQIIEDEKKDAFERVRQDITILDRVDLMKIREEIDKRLGE